MRRINRVYPVDENTGEVHGQTPLNRIVPNSYYWVVFDGFRHGTHMYGHEIRDHRWIENRHLMKFDHEWESVTVCSLEKREGFTMTQTIICAGARLMEAGNLAYEYAERQGDDPFIGIEMSNDGDWLIDNHVAIAEVL